jgi:hypothetical protein
MLGWCTCHEAFLFLKWGFVSSFFSHFEFYKKRSHLKSVFFLSSILNQCWVVLSFFIKVVCRVEYMGHLTSSSQNKPKTGGSSDDCIVSKKLEPELLWFCQFSEIQNQNFCNSENFQKWVILSLKFIKKWTPEVQRTNHTTLVITPMWVHYFWYILG